MKVFEQGNEWMRYWNENQKSLFEAWSQGKPPPFAAMGAAPPVVEGVENATGFAAELMRRTMEQWTELGKQAFGQAGRFDPEAMKKLFDPAEWRRAGSHFDMGLERLAEGPTYATLWDLDRKMARAQKLYIERAKDVEGYWEIVQRAWNKTLTRFMKAVNDPKGEPITNGRQLLDLWLSTANRALLEMHRSEEFLEAQRAMTRSSAEYQLAEREIAETFCEMHHIPTRTEMDEVQRTVTELKRQVRELKRQAPAPQPKASSRRRPGSNSRKK